MKSGRGWLGRWFGRDPMDGMLCGAHDGRLYQVFAPRPWELARWWGWIWKHRRQAFGTITITQRFHDGERTRVVRVFLAGRQLPGCGAEANSEIVVN